MERVTSKTGEAGQTKPQAVAALTIAGSDSGGGAGIQADLKTFSALGVFGCSAITALTAQNTRAVTRVEAAAPGMIAAQIAAVLDDIEIGAIKIGMLATVAVIEEVTAALDGYQGPIVLDPVMVAKSGDALLATDAIDALTTLLLPRATVLTPNLPEAARILGVEEAANEAEALDQGRKLCELGAKAVLMKGGHGTGDVCVDRLVSKDSVVDFSAPRIVTQNTHGTGCTLSSAIAAELAKGRALPQAVGHAHSWLHAAIKAADQINIGQGHGPVHHFHAVWS
ncbi:bifunctional hydroxymethylpyrimidine kinase/phosphomethylpyrimidine kinase [Epibacterium sp. SM1979]|uniref:hydroxymethylpyrimidine kinase n=1 Tax=Tritonibacter litoralis TaxID=2662264 RepID=A0A843YAC4_9RHOB|nr:bifunctional hydroxymethylpyrimidine kinase/phosphomethylpyrimidine kinase [Tritonibacter litoralis]MQQ06838.1 bifunctional hydroxymethylpyrimidine kinase/phosphomethylpyrimidine kinase [Tritonibacter litoralis]